MADVLNRAGPVAGTGSEATIYTCPGSPVKATAIEIRIVNNDTVARDCTMSIGAGADGTRVLPDTITIQPKQIYKDDSALVLLSGETLRWNGHAKLTITVSLVES